MNPRVLKLTNVRCLLMLPMGLRLHQNEAGHMHRAMLVSTVCLDDAHLESLIPRAVDPEHGYETMIFLAETSFFGLYQQHYKTRAEALRGHKSAVNKLIAGKLPLSIRIDNYSAVALMPDTAAAA